MDLKEVQKKFRHFPSGEVLDNQWYGLFVGPCKPLANAIDMNQEMLNALYKRGGLAFRSDGACGELIPYKKIDPFLEIHQDLSYAIYPPTLRD